MKTVILTILVALALIPISLMAQDSAGDGLAQAKSEVRQVVSNMGKALEAADCKRVSEFFGESFSFYVRGRHIASRDAVLASCREIPRPFPQWHYEVNEIQPLSETSALALRVLHLTEGTRDGKPKREVITQIWQRNDEDLWRILHMHVSINDMPVASDNRPR